MLSQQTSERLRVLRANEATYQPTTEIRAAIRSKIGVLVVGASCQGKNTIMNEVVRLDKRFKIIGTFVSRPPRNSDHGLPYTYYEHTDAGLAPILDKIEQRRVVQYAVNPYSGFLYGSMLSDYPTEYNIGDYFSSGVEPFRQLGFKAAPAVSVISPAEEWVPRFTERFPLGHSERVARRDEAIESINWSLSQTVDHTWVVNRTGQVTEAAMQLINSITSPTSEPNKEAESMARQAIMAIKEIEI